MAILAVSLVAAGVSIGLRPADEDSDHDGLTDAVEQRGWATLANGVYVTDPDDPDTDDDGLTDGEEAGALVSKNSGKVYLAHSSPTRKDSDSDTVGDAEEFVLDMDARSRDTDDDGLDDDVEMKFGSDPTLENADADSYDDKEEYERESDPLAYNLTRGEGIKAFLVGAVTGDSDWAAHRAGLNDVQIESVEYLAGDIASGVVGIGDLRDFAVKLGKGEFIGALVSAAGLVPVAGDTAKTAAKLTSFATRGGRAGRAAFNFVNGQRWPTWTKKSILTKVLKKSVGSLPFQLVGGPSATTVYLCRTPDGVITCAGLTDDIESLQADQADDSEIVQLADAAGLTRGEAAAVAEALVQRGGVLASGEVVEIRIHPIDPTSAYHEEAVSWGDDWLEEHGQPIAQSSS